MIHALTSVQCSILGRPIPFTPTAKRPGTCIWSASQSPGIDSDASLIQCGWGRSRLRTQSQRGTCTLLLAAFLTKLQPASLDPVPSSHVQSVGCIYCRPRNLVAIPSAPLRHATCIRCHSRPSWRPIVSLIEHSGELLWSLAHNCARLPPSAGPSQSFIRTFPAPLPHRAFSGALRWPTKM